MKKIILLIMCLFPAALFAQTATDYFHNAANYYVNANKKSALSTVMEGIQKFPNDQKLRNLASKIGELPEPEDEQDQQNQQNQQNQDNQDRQDQQRQQQQDQELSISKEDAERLLNSLANDEKEVHERVRLEKAAQERKNSARNW